jgi:hypothetical protein
MTQDAAESTHIHIAFSYEDSKEDSSSGIMKRPLVAANTRCSTNNASLLEPEEQTWLVQDKQERKGLVVWKAFLVGAVFGFVVQGMAFCHLLCHHQDCLGPKSHLIFRFLLEQPGLVLDIGWIESNHFVYPDEISVHAQKVGQGCR